MSFNGSGVFVRLYSWVNDAAANIKIRADRMDNEMNGMATALSTCITKDGQTTVTANLPMAGFRHTGVGDATVRNNYASFGQMQDGKSAWVDGGGTSDAITASYTVPITSLADGQLCYVRATAANATTTPTFSPSALTARTIVKNGGAALVAGDISGDGHELILRYDLTNTRWELMNPKVSIPQTIPFTAASASGPASLQLAEDTDNGTNKITLIAPAAIAADVSVTLPGTADTLVGRATTDTLTNKTLTEAVDGLTVFAAASATSNATLANVSGTTVNLVTGSTYLVEVTGLFNASPGGHRLGFGGTATQSASNLRGMVDTAGVATGFGAGSSMASGLFSNSSTTGGLSWFLRGYYTCNGSGTLLLQYAQNTSNVTASTANLSMKLTRVG